MTAPLADQTTSSSTDQTTLTPTGRPPEISVALLTVGLACAAWVVYFASLVAVYLTAFDRKVKPCEAAAGWGLAIAFAAALLTVPFAVSWPTAARRASVPVPRIAAWMVGVLLALGSVAVVWVAVNLTLARDSAGSWMLTVCGTAAPLVVLLARLALLSHTEVVLHDDVAVPRAVTAPEPEMAAVTTVITADVAETDAAPTDVVSSPELAEAEAAEPELAELDAADPDLAEFDLAVADVAPDDTVSSDLQDYSLPDKADVGVVQPPFLLAPDWAERLGSRPPRVAIDSGMWEAVLAAIGRRRTEVGGVALTVRVPGTLIVVGLVLPQQVQANGVFCEFRAEEVSRVRNAIDGVTDILSLDSRDVKITWVHTHPGMGPFLSGTDQATTQTWRAFDPEFTPIVLDPLAQRLNKQIGVFDTDNRKIDQLRVVAGLADSYTVGLLREELIDAYRDAKGTMVLFGAD